MGFIENPQIGSLVTFRAEEIAPYEFKGAVGIVCRLELHSDYNDVIIHWCELQSDFQIWSRLSIGAFNRYLQVVSQ